jgi:glycosyltransferase involved in cell wall biosynthesis
VVFEIIPNGVDLASYRDIDEIPQPNRLIFTGSLTFIPNCYTMHWFVEQVYPLIQIEVPDVHFAITGGKTGQKLPDARNAHLVGYVDDVRPLIASSWISLAPIFSGGGTTLKILEAFALRTPVLATTKGAEGLEVQHNEHLLLADTPEAFAGQTVRLLNDKNLRQKLVSSGYKLVFDRYDWSVIKPKYLKLIDHTVKSSRRNPEYIS